MHNTGSTDTAFRQQSQQVSIPVILSRNHNVLAFELLYEKTKLDSGTRDRPVETDITTYADPLVKCDRKYD